MFRFGRGRIDLKIYFSRGWKCFHRDKYHRFRPTSNVPRYIRIVRLTVRKTDRTELFPRCDNTSRAFFHSNSLIRSFFLFFQIFSLSSLPRSMTWCHFFWSFVYFPVFFSLSQWISLFLCLLWLSSLLPFVSYSFSSLSAFFLTPPPLWSPVFFFSTIYSLCHHFPLSPDF